jgi:hypothetical protein
LAKAFQQMRQGNATPVLDTPELREAFSQIPDGPDERLE